MAIEACYHQTMDRRLVAGKPSGTVAPGDISLPISRPPVEVLAAGSSDWVVFAGPNGYAADEAYFLHFIIHTIHTALTGHPHLDAERFTAWIAQRHAQVEQGTLVYIAHQLDLLGRCPRLAAKQESLGARVKLQPNWHVSTGSTSVRGRMSTEQLIRDFYNEMHSVHTQPGNAYDMGDHLRDLTVHKHLDQDPLIQFREAYQWVQHTRAEFVADVAVAMEASPPSWPARRRLSTSMAIRSAMCNRLSPSRCLPACTCRTRVCCCRAMTASCGSTMRLSPLNRSATRPVGATLHHWARHLRPGGLVVIIDEIFRSEVSPEHPEIQQFMQSWRFSLLLQRTRVEALVQAAGLHIAAWVSLSERYHAYPAG